MSTLTAYPLTWPDGRPRTAPRARKHGRFKTSFAVARFNLINEIKLLGGKDLILSSNIRLRIDGIPYANERPVNGDPGFACYFKRKEKQLCFACDCYLTVDDNLQAIALTITALRGIARWGTGDMMEAAFTGFTALPEKTTDTWWEVLEVAHDSSEEQVKDSYRALAKKWHPDVNNGESGRFLRIQEAWNNFNQIKHV